MQREEAGAREEGHRDQKDAGVIATGGRLTEQEAEAEVDHGGEEDEPEMRRVVLPDGVELGPNEQKGEPDDGERDGESPDEGTHQRISARRRWYAAPRKSCRCWGSSRCSRTVP